MVNIRRHIALTFFPLFMVIFLGGCREEEFTSFTNGTLQLNIGHISQKTETRATPSQLGKPLVDRFNLKVQRIGNGYAAYEGRFVDNLELSVGTYNIMAYYGENVALGKDCPYYEGAATATIEKDQSSSVTIPCRVANALVSVAFGRDEAERARFDKFYKDYGLRVRIGNQSIDLESDEAKQSIYFPAGSAPTLIFYGTLREDDRVVSFELQSDNLPTIYEAAEHAIVTLTLPDPESALTINISKVEVETVTIGETIPLSWLPAPVVTAQHIYDGAGYLQGTDVEFSNSYPGMPWRAVVTNAAGVAVRSIEADDTLLSSYDSSSEYPYLPSGDYKATYYIVDGASATEVSSVMFSLGKPNLKLLVGGYTSYTKYLEGDVDGANACDGKSAYDISVSLNVAERVLAKNDYTFTFCYGSGYTENVEAGKNRFYRETLTNQTASIDPYQLVSNVMFDGVSLSASRDFYVTGLPVTYAPPKTEDGWSKASGTVSFNAGEAKLENGSISNSSLAIPAQTKVAMDYNVKIRAGGLWSSNKLTITLGNDEMFSKSLSGGLVGKEESSQDSKTVTLTSQALMLKCSTTKSYSNIYSLSLKYSK